MSMMLKFGARKQPNAEILKDRRPTIRSDLALNRTLKAPMNRAEKAAVIEEEV